MISMGNMLEIYLTASGKPEPIKSSGMGLMIKAGGLYQDYISAK